MHQTHAALLTTALVGRCLAIAARHDALIRLEVDEADLHLWTLMEQLPVVAEPDWFSPWSSIHDG